MRPPLVEVIWHDAFNSAQWKARRHVIEEWHTNPCVCCTVGWLVRSDKTGVTIASTFSGLDDLCGTFHIPRGMIQKFTVLRKARTS